MTLGVLFGGCVSRPTPSYQKVDQHTPAFKEAVNREAELQKALGKTPDEAEEAATVKITGQLVAAEKTRRIEQVAPLMHALEAFDRVAGCWAYTLTTTHHIAGQTTVTVERFDAFQPEERLWTLITRDGAAPDEAAQTDYRKAKLRVWKQQLDRRPPRYSWPERVKRNALSEDWEITAPAQTGQVMFTFTRGHGHVVALGDLPASRETYTIDAGGETVLRHTQTFLEPAAILGGSVKYEIWDSSSEYMMIEPQLPPFLSKTKMRYRIHVFGKDTGEVEIETIYTDYRRVKCYDERFGVKVGEPNILDFIPSLK